MNVLYSLVDRISIGHIPGEGAVALTGVGVTFPALMLIAAFSFLIAMGAAMATVAFLAIFRKILVLIPLIFILPRVLKNKVFAVLITTTLFRRAFWRVINLWRKPTCLRVG